MHMLLFLEIHNMDEVYLYYSCHRGGPQGQHIQMEDLLILISLCMGLEQKFIFQSLVFLMFQFLVFAQKDEQMLGFFWFFGGIFVVFFSGIIIQEPGLAFYYQRQWTENTSQYIVLIFKKVIFIIFYSLFNYFSIFASHDYCVFSLLMLVSFLPSAWLIHLSSQLNSISF